jgi:hypothetical protein
MESGMRLSDWQARARHPESMTPSVVASATDALALLGAGRDPECWIVWGDDPGVRYAILAPVPAGLVMVNVRVNVPGEGPRSSGKIVRWHRIQVGELTVETQGGHRIITFQVESQIFRSTDTEADEVAAFVDGLFAAMDGRSPAMDSAILLPGPTASSSSEAAAVPPGAKASRR